jgi:hypothetical protein
MKVLYTLASCKGYSMNLSLVLTEFVNQARYSNREADCKWEVIGLVLSFLYFMVSDLTHVESG